MKRAMKQKVVLAALALLMALSAKAQTGLQKVYNEDINPLEQVEQAVAQAKANG